MIDLSLVREVKNILLEAEISDAEFDAREIVRFAAEKGGDERENALALARRRAGHEPLQYILGFWEFMGIEFKVSRGVLIPRADTEILCELIIETVKKTKNPTVFDLCAGSGCIGLSVAKMTDAAVTLFEKSPEALAVLRENRDKISPSSTVTECDVLTAEVPEGIADIIVSNPPYIKSEVIKGLSEEVQREPKMALDGGADGLTFYRSIANRWKKALKKGGTLAFEIGCDQRAEVTEILTEAGYKNVKFLHDYGGNDRVVYGTKQ